MAERLSSSNLTQSPRLSRACTGLLMYSQWKVKTLDAEPTTQDGSNSSDGLIHTSITDRNQRRLWEFKVRLILKIDKSRCKIKLKNSKIIKLGISSMSKTGRVNQKLENGTETSA